MGSRIIKEVVNELLTKGLDNAKVLLLAGSRSVWPTVLYIFVFKSSVAPSDCTSSHQCWRYGRPAERGPRRRAAGVTGPQRSAGQGLGRLRMVPG